MSHPTASKKTRTSVLNHRSRAPPTAWEDPELTSQGCHACALTHRHGEGLHGCCLKPLVFGNLLCRRRVPTQW